ncbi:carbohydrate ABC transporter permease [Brachybacterium huguangmaarense]
MTLGGAPGTGMTDREPPIAQAPSAATRREPRRRPSRRPAWQERPTIPGRLGKGTALVLIVLAVLLPLYTVVLTSLSTEATINASGGGMVLVPQGLTLDAYRTILSGGIVTRSILVSLGVTAVGTALSTAVSVLAAYGLSRTGSVLHRPILFVFLITMFFSAGMIPTYLVVSGLGLVNSWWALILPGAVSAFNVLILRAFFMGIDQEILDAARIDGAGEFRVLGSIVLPMSTAVIAVIALFYGVGYWNSFFSAMLYLTNADKWPLQMVLRSYVLEGVKMPGSELAPAGIEGSAPPSSLAIKMAIVVIALVPILLVYPFVQRHFTKGVIFGAVKG